MAEITAALARPSVDGSHSQDQDRSWTQLLARLKNAQVRVRVRVRGLGLGLGLESHLLDIDIDVHMDATTIMICT